MTIVPAPEDIAGVILAGGRGSRLGGEDKGLMLLDGRPLIDYVVERLRPQVGELLISANRNTERYAAFGCPVVPDLVPDYQGPLAGIASALQTASAPYIAIVPCDAPLIGADLVARLAQALAFDRAEIAVAYDGERVQPVFVLMPCWMLESLLAFLAGGERKVDRWFIQHRVAQADFSDCPEIFSNVNDPEQLRALEARMREK